MAESSCLEDVSSSLSSAQMRVMEHRTVQSKRSSKPDMSTRMRRKTACRDAFLNKTTIKKIKNNLKKNLLKRKIALEFCRK